MAKRAGLPDSIRMRHDGHYVDTLSGPAGTPIGRLVPIEQIDPNPDQPRQTMGDLSELIASISEKGVLEPLIVRHKSGRFQIIAGERRYQASVQVGLQELPVVIRDVDEDEVIELALVENLQRKDLTAFEEAEALQSVVERNNLTHEELARRLGKSRTAITEALAISKMPEEVKTICRLADISSKSLLLQIVRESDPAKMIALVERLTRDGGAPTRKQAREATSPAKRGRPKAFTFNYRAPSRDFKLRMTFSKRQVERGEIISALERLLEELRRSK